MIAQYHHNTLPSSFPSSLLPAASFCEWRSCRIGGRAARWGLEALCRTGSSSPWPPGFLHTAVLRCSCHLEEQINCNEIRLWITSCILQCHMILQKSFYADLVFKKHFYVENVNIFVEIVIPICNRNIINVHLMHPCKILNLIYLKKSYWLHNIQQQNNINNIII